MSNDPLDDGKVWVPTLGERLARARRDAALTQMQMADLCDLSQKTIARIELDLATPKRTTIDAYARHTNYSRAFLATGRIPTSPLPPPVNLSSRRRKNNGPDQAESPSGCIALAAAA